MDNLSLIDSASKIGGLLDEMGACLSSGNSKYYFLPYWFEKTESGDFVAHHLDKLPDELIKEIKAIRGS